MVYLWPATLAGLGLVVFVLQFFVVAAAGWFCFVLGLALLLWAAGKGLREHMGPSRADQHARLPGARRDRAVGPRPCRSRACSTSPCARRCSAGSSATGTFVFESAAQEQGLREISFVPRPDRLDC